MDLGKNKDKATKKLQTVVNTDGRSRWLFEWEGHYWASGIKPDNPAIEFLTYVTPGVV